MNKKTIFIILTLLSFILGSGAIGYLYYYTNPIKNNRPDLSDSKYLLLTQQVVSAVILI